MELGIKTFKDLIEVIVWIVGAASLAVAAYSYLLNRNQFNFSVITSCTERFQRIMFQMKLSDGTEKEMALKQYIDLCNEELFYFKNKYLPDEVIYEWIEGMIYYLPHYLNSKNVNLEETAKEIDKANLLDGYSRIKNAFTVDREYNLEHIQERERLISLIRRNIKRSLR